MIIHFKTRNGDGDESSSHCSITTDGEESIKKRKKKTDKKKIRLPLINSQWNRKEGFTFGPLHVGVCTKSHKQIWVHN